MGRLRTFILLALMLGLNLVPMANAQLETIAKRPYYNLTASLHPTQMRANGTLLVRYVNQTGVDLHRLVFAMDNPLGREDVITRVRVNKRAADVVYLQKEKGDPFDGFELDAKRALPPDVVSEIEITFVSRCAVERDGLVIFQGDWFPRILGPTDAPHDPDDRSLMDVDATIDYPVEWRAALSGLILREDGVGDRAEMFNAAAGIKNYGVVLGRELRVLEDELYGISVRVFTPDNDEDWGSRVLRQISAAVEHYKRRTPVTPPLILNVVMDSPEVEHASVLFANTLALPYHSGMPIREMRVELGYALTALYWGFGGASGPLERPTSLENALSLYGVLNWARETNGDSSWVEQWDSRFHAGLLVRHHPAIMQSVGQESANGFAREIGSANAFLTLRMLENTLPDGVLKKVWDQAIVQYAHAGMDRERLAGLLSEYGITAEDALLIAFDQGLPVMDARIVRTENRGRILDAWVTEIHVARVAAENLPIPVGVVQTDGRIITENLTPGHTSVVIRSPLPPARAILDPNNSFPLVSSAGRNREAVVLVATALAAEGRWSEVRTLIDDLDRDGLEWTGAVVHLWAEALLRTGYYLRARDLLYTAVENGKDDSELGGNLLLLGKTCDLLGQRAQAIEAYRNAANHIGISTEATRYLESPYTQKE